MSLPTPSDVHVNRPLTNISVAYIQSQSRFIADRVFPRVPVSRQSDRYFTYTKGDWFREEVAVRAPGSVSTGSGWRVDNTPTYFCDVLATHKDIDDQLRANVDAPLNLERDATEWLTQQVMLKRDKDWASTFFTTSVWGRDKAGVTSGPTGTQFLRWDETGSTPIEDIHAEKIYLTEQTAVDPENLVLVVSPYVHNVLVDHSTVLERIKYTQRGVVSEDILANLFGVRRYLVAWATNNTANEAAAATMNFVFGKHALLVYAAPAPSLMTPSGGYIFTWTGYAGAGAFGNRIRRFRMEDRQSDRLEVEMAYDMKVIASDVGVFFQNAVS